jgi:hypothetical protein
MFACTELLRSTASLSLWDCNAKQNSVSKFKTTTDILPHRQQKSEAENRYRLTLLSFLLLILLSIILRIYIFGPKTDDITGEWTNLHNEELHNL